MPDVRRGGKGDDLESWTESCRVQQVGREGRCAEGREGRLVASLGSRLESCGGEGRDEGSRSPGRRPLREECDLGLEKSFYTAVLASWAWADSSLLGFFKYVWRRLTHAQSGAPIGNGDGDPETVRLPASPDGDEF